MAARENEADRRPVSIPSGSITITPSDTAVLATICSKLYLGNETAANTIKLRLLDGSTPTLTLAVGTTILDVQFDMVFNTGTTLANAAIGFFNL